MATRKPRRFGAGGETADKEEGLKASKDEKVGFLERLRMGNIDDPNSEAYRRFGAGRGKAERVPVEDRVATPMKREEPKAEAPKADEDEMEAANKREPIPVSAGKKAEPDAPAKEARKPAAKPAAKNEYAAAPKKDTGNYSNEGRGSKPKSSESSKRSLVDQIPLDAPRAPVKGEKVDSTELSRNINNALNATPGIQAVGRMAGAGKAAQKAGSRAVSTAVDDGVTFLGKSGRRQVGGFDEVAGSGARQIANNPTRQLPAPPKQIGGPSKPELMAKNRAARDAKRRAEMGEENAARYNLDPKSSDYADRAKSIRDNLGGDDFTLGMKRGGKVKPAAKGWGMARGARAAKMR